MTIKTDRNAFEWSAWDEDNWEPGLPIGYGATVMEAIEDLLNKIEDAQEKENIHRRATDTDCY